MTGYLPLGSDWPVRESPTHGPASALRDKPDMVETDLKLAAKLQSPRRASAIATVHTVSSVKRQAVWKSSKSGGGPGGLSRP